jgi:predicted kinase
MIAFFGRHMSRVEFDERLDRCRNVIWSVSEQALASNIDVVLDFGFWKREERTRIRKLIETAGAHHKLYYLRCTPEIAKMRLRERNKDLSTQYFEITDEMFELFQTQFEKPSIDEGLNLIEIDTTL